MPAPSQLHLRTALQLIAAGGVVACPTEAVWGLSCDPHNSLAVADLLRLKRRPLAKGLILVAAEQQQFDFLLYDLPVEQQRLLTASWPGPNTWLIPHRGRVAPWIHGDHETVAVRVSAHPVLRRLSRDWGGPLVSTSANPAGAQPPRHLFQVKRYFGDQLDYLLPGALGRSPRPTAIRDLATGQPVRV